VRFGLRVPSYAWPDLAHQSTRDLATYGRRAEELEFDSLWVIDHFLRTPALYDVSWLDPFGVLAYLAGVTSRIQLGTGILVLPIRHPVLVAKEVATLVELSRGRFIFGVGTGWDEKEFRTMGVSLAQRGARTDECLEIIRRLLTEDAVSHKGRFYSFDEVSLDPRPAETPAVWVAGGSLGHAPETPDLPVMARGVLKRIAQADAWLSRSSGSDASMVKADWETVKKYLVQVGRNPSDIVFGHTQFVHVSEGNRDEALTEQMPLFIRVMGSHRTLDDLSASYLMGTVDEIQNRISELQAVGLQYLLLTPVSDDPRQLELLHKHIVAPFSQ
jgi:probable F420-dependent oxidoreductase